MKTLACGEVFSCSKILSLAKKGSKDKMSPFSTAHGCHRGNGATRHQGVQRARATSCHRAPAPSFSWTTSRWPTRATAVWHTCPRFPELLVFARSASLCNPLGAKRKRKHDCFGSALNPPENKAQISQLQSSAQGKELSLKTIYFLFK